MLSAPGLSQTTEIEHMETTVVRTPVTDTLLRAAVNKSTSRWMVYEVPPIDLGWQYAKTPERVIEEMTVDPNDMFGYMPRDAMDLYVSFLQAEIAVGHIGSGFDGVIRENQPPVVFAIPTENEMLAGFVFKADNNGDTFVASPIPLTYLDQVAHEVGLVQVTGYEARRL